MNVNKFSNYLLLVLSILQVIGLIIFLIFYRYLGPKSIPIVLVLIFIIDFLSIKMLKNVKVYDKKGNKVQSIFSIFGDMIAVTVWSFIISIAILIVGMIVSFHISGKYNLNKIAAFSIPILSTIAFYGALAVADRCN